MKVGEMVEEDEVQINANQQTTRKPKVVAEAEISLSASDVKDKYRNMKYAHLLSDSDRDSILQGLDEIERKIEADKFEWRTDREDVHMNIEAALTDLIDEPAKKLHTARYKNDQLATDFRLWCRDAIYTIIVKIKHFQTALVQLSLESMHWKLYHIGFCCTKILH